MSMYAAVAARANLTASQPKLVDATSPTCLDSAAPGHASRQQRASAVLQSQLNDNNAVAYSSNASWVISAPFSMAPLTLASIGGMWAGLGLDTKGGRAWQTWCFMNGTVILAQFSFNNPGGPVVDGMCEIPIIVEGITYFDDRVEARGPFMPVADQHGNMQIIAFWLPNATDGDVAVASDSEALERFKARRDFVPFTTPAQNSRSGDADSDARISAFLSAIPTCGTRNISTFENYEGSWAMRFDGNQWNNDISSRPNAGLTPIADNVPWPIPTAITFSDPLMMGGQSIAVTAYNVLNGSVMWSTPAMPLNYTCSGASCDWDYAWIEWNNDTIVIAGDHDYTLGADFVAVGNPVQWAAACDGYGASGTCTNTSLVTLDGLHAEGTSSFTSAYNSPRKGVSASCVSAADEMSSSADAAPYPLTLQQITDNSFSCKPTGDVDTILEWTVHAPDGNGQSAWQPGPGSNLMTCPEFVAAGAGACITPLVVAWEPL